MVTKYDKSLVALLVPLVLYFINWLATQAGAQMTPEVEQAIETVLFWLLPLATGAAVLAWPNKKE